jgi:ChrR Cupin-like domain
MNQASPLQEDILAALLQAEIDNLGPPSEAPAADLALLQRVQQRVMRRIAQDSTASHLTIAADQGWKPFAKGIHCKVLHQQGDCTSYLLRLEPGAQLAAHRHPLDEECVVLEGEVQIGTAIRLGPGGFHLGRKDVLHDSIGSEGGAVIYLRGATPSASLAI